MRNIIFRVIVLVLITAPLTLNLFFPVNSYSMGVEEAAPDFTIESIKEEKITLSDLLKDRPVVLVFWTTWCPSCRAEVPHIEKFYKENKNEVAIIGINIGESKAKVSSFIQKMGISYPIALDPESRVAKLYNVVGIPTIVAIDKNSKVTYFGHSMEEMTRR